MTEGRKKENTLKNKRQKILWKKEKIFLKKGKKNCLDIKKARDNFIKQIKMKKNRGKIVVWR